MSKDEAQDIIHVHGGIRHLEMYRNFWDMGNKVHGGIRHLEI